LGISILRLKRKKYILKGLKELSHYLLFIMKNWYKDTWKIKGLH